MLSYKTIKIEVDKASWGGNTVPPSFVSGIWTFSLLEMLLMIGVLTTPVSARGTSLAEFWAFLRYATLVDSCSELRLIETYEEVDPHQKTILSDDFGMGVSLLYMFHTIGFLSFVDGLYFKKQMTRMGVIPKTGSNKSADFVLWDSVSNLHVVECKGTQNGRNKRTEQLKAGLAQKWNMPVPPAQVGESLVTGLCIARTGNSESSSLKLVDPPQDGTRSASSDDYSELIVRSMLARSLKLSGFPETAVAIANAPFDSSTFLPKQVIDLGAQRSSAELDAYFETLSDGHARRNRSRTFDLARPDVPGKSLTVTLEDELNIDLLRIISDRRSGFSNGQLAGLLEVSPEDFGIQLNSDEVSARLNFGSIFSLKVRFG